MFETVILAFVGAALVLALASAAGALALHWMYGPDLPQGVQPLANTFTTVYTTGAAVLLAPFKVLSRTSVAAAQGPPTPTTPPNLPDSNSRQITNQ
ncbi:MAG TPA: hypothetical protein VFB45_04690 [Pseudolabrys sp.]|nr:hypothetical protein [Pseudolabrys sp.]